MVELIKDTNYEEKIKSGKVVIDCFADWCGPCKMLSPVLDNISSELKVVNFYKINVDDAEKITKDYNIVSIPTLLIFENGVLKNQVVGLRSKDELLEIINK